MPCHTKFVILLAKLLVAGIQDFVAMCLDNRQPIATPVAGRMSVAAGVCAAHSLRNGGIPVTVPSLPEGLGEA